MASPNVGILSAMRVGIGAPFFFSLISRLLSFGLETESRRVGRAQVRFSELSGAKNKRGREWVYEIFGLDFN